MSYRDTRKAARYARRTARYAARNARRGYRYPYYGRPGRSIIGVVLLIIVAIYIFTHLLPLLIAGAIILGLIAAGWWFLSNWARNSSVNGSYQPPQAPPQPQQPYQQYQPYQQGYQPPQSQYQEGGQQYNYPSQSSYPQYEEPQAQYPDQMPPMQQ